MKSRDKIYRLEIAIKDLRPTIWRDVVVPGDYSLRDLHLVLQSAMGWENCHRHATIHEKCNHHNGDRAFIAPEYTDHK